MSDLDIHFTSFYHHVASPWLRQKYVGLLADMNSQSWKYRFQVTITLNNYLFSFVSLFKTAPLILVHLRFPVDSIRAAMLTVSPNRQYLGMMRPTTPATTGPVCRPVHVNLIKLPLPCYAKNKIVLWENCLANILFFWVSFLVYILCLMMYILSLER